MFYGFLNLKHFLFQPLLSLCHLWTPVHVVQHYRMSLKSSENFFLRIVQISKRFLSFVLWDDSLADWNFGHQVLLILSSFVVSFFFLVISDVLWNFSEVFVKAGEFVWVWEQPCGLFAYIDHFIAVRTSACWSSKLLRGWILVRLGQNFLQRIP